MNSVENDSPAVIRKTTKNTPGKLWQNWLIGRPLPTADAPHQTIGKFIGLAVFSSDAMSSVAYAPQELLAILVVAGPIGLSYSVPLAISIVALLAILTLSYEQTIHTYPNGGGAYIVARDNLGETPALVAAASLLMDYILTVAVSISSSVAQLSSAFPALYKYRVEIAVIMVIFIMIINLRGVREAGTAFAIPTYYFLAMMYLTVIIGLVRFAAGTLGLVDAPPMDMMGEQVLQPLTLFLILRAFSNGTTALTGVEAISNGVTAFKEPRAKNAGATLIWMAGILGSLMLGITFLSKQIQALPSEHETLISQLARTVYNSEGILYFLTITSATVILMMAANTAFAGFPRLGAMAAEDGYLPRQLTYRGSRLVYSYGISVLAIIASFLIILFQASVTKLIPLYAVGVFLSFTLSQAGMAHRWWKSGRLEKGGEVKERGSMLKHSDSWLIKMLINGLGAVATLMVTLIFGITKFTEGAYVVVFLIPIMVVIFSGIHRHYRTIAKHLSLEDYGTPPHIVRHRVIIPIGGVHRGSLAALHYARELSDDITVVYVSTNPEDTEKLQDKWEQWGDGLRLVILDSPYRLFFEPLLEYIQQIDDKRQPNEMITIVVPQFVPTHIWNNLLHQRTADNLRKILLHRKNIVITEVPYQVD